MATELAGIAVRTGSGLKVCVPATLGCVSTYILLEQEAWFEKEAQFVERLVEPGDTAVDIGANYGVYALALARAVGPDGQVFAYEPSAQTAAYLAESKKLNAAASLVIEQRALSDTEGWAQLYTSSMGGEFHALQPGQTHGGASEGVPLTTLDVEQRRHNWTRLDFLKIDAEGEEARIIAGGVGVLTDQSPLVMFEIKHEKGVDLGVANALHALGYELYRLIGPAVMLVPADLSRISSSELNLFAAKPDRAQIMEAKGLLARKLTLPEHLTADDARWVFDAPHHRHFAIQPGEIDGAYTKGLAAFGVWRDEARPPDERFGALILALNELRGAAQSMPNASRIAMLARASWEADEWQAAHACLTELVRVQALPTGEPFLAVHPRFDTLSAEGQASEWFFVAIMELAEKINAFSSIFRQSHYDSLMMISRSRLASPEMPRRLAMQLVRSGKPFPPGLDAVLAGEDHLNRDYLTPERLKQLCANLKPAS